VIHLIICIILEDKPLWSDLNLGLPLFLFFLKATFAVSYRGCLASLDQYI
jgi:hypothetical protein